MFPRRMLGNGKEDRGVWDMVFKVLKLGILLTAGAPGVSVPRHNPGLSGSFRSDTVNEHSHPNALEETGAGKAPIMGTTGNVQQCGVSSSESIGSSGTSRLSGKPQTS
ncbi:unnamed protein product [Merluccius merluccius]